MATKTMPNRKANLMSAKRTEKGDYIQDEFAWRALAEQHHDNERSSLILNILIAAAESAIEKLEK
jgi:hypothetical protein